jgi:hypothetical protein
MTVPFQTNRDALQTWLADFLSSNITISERRRRLVARSDYQPERQMHGDATGAEPLHSSPSWNPLTLASSQNEESDFAAERRWENEGGNPGQLQQLLCDDRKEDATTCPARGTLKAFCYEVNGTCT